MSDTRQHVHEMVDRLDTGQLAAVGQLLEVMTDPVARSLAGAPVEDEEISEEEEQAVARSKEWFKHNEGIPFEQVVTDLGFTMDQVRGHSLDEDRLNGAKDPAA